MDALDSLIEYSRELRRRVKLEFRVELPLLLARWKQVLLGAMFQYVHGMSTQLAHRMHRPQEEPLGDLGFTYLPELGLERAWIMCQFLRIISFTVTQLPAPNYHCRAGEETAVLDMPDSWHGHVVVDVGRQATHGCGDLIFSSHTTFVLVGVLTFTEYGEKLFLKIIAWCGVAMMSLCIVASRKHYSVDVVVAWYTVPLVFYAMHRRWTTVRPVQDYWPHRPIIGEELGLTLKEEELTMDGAKGESKPLLPVVTVPLAYHTRSGSRSDARGAQANRGRDKEPTGNVTNGGAQTLKAGMNGLVRAQRRGSASSLSLRELEMQEMENGSLQGNSIEMSSSPGSSNTACSII
eukprot:jgi/Picsp_1/6317/NSC_03666-R1_inositol phosphorylceramide synthase 1